jgi:hypothetical protein
VAQLASRAAFGTSCSAPGSVIMPSSQAARDIARIDPTVPRILV